MRGPAPTTTTCLRCHETVLEAVQELEHERVAVGDDEVHAHAVRAEPPTQFSQPASQPASTRRDATRWMTMVHGEQHTDDTAAAATTTTTKNAGDKPWEYM